MRVVYDCMIFLRAVGNPDGDAMLCVELAENGHVELLISPAVLAEIRDVLHRPELMNRFRRLTEERATQFLDRLCQIATVIDNPPRTISLPRDPDDEIYLDLGVAGGATFLVTENRRHLNYLMNGDTPEGREFLNRYPTLQIVTTKAFLDAVAPRGGL